MTTAIGQAMNNSDPHVTYKLREPVSHELTPPRGQAAGWYNDAIYYVPPSGQHVARQLARLAGEGSQITIPWRSLADAVGIADKRGRYIAYTQRGTDTLKDAGWLRVESSGRGCAATTTFYLIPGDLTVPGDDETHWQEHNPTE